MTTVFFSLEKTYFFCYTKAIKHLQIHKYNKLIKGAMIYVKNLSLVSCSCAIFSCDAD